MILQDDWRQDLLRWVIHATWLPYWVPGTRTALHTLVLVDSILLHPAVYCVVICCFAAAIVVVVLDDTAVVVVLPPSLLFALALSFFVFHLFC